MIYEGTPEEIQKLLSSLPSNTYTEQSKTNEIKAIEIHANSDLDRIARNFRARLDEVVSYGRKGPMDAIIRWLEKDGVIDLTELWQAAGVASLREYAAIGSSLTRHMVGAGGTNQWYRGKPHPDKRGEWQYHISPELVEPLRRAFLA
jgi:hypothetical protein